MADQLATASETLDSGDNLDALRARVTDLEQEARGWIRQQPVVAVLTALGVGFLVARLVARVTR
jgi:ElaB/YqjD/DUF883 family membrane-anchored ribosome-binding protein